ncbi:Flp pilus assembly complex ATPase component TadA [Candidatus Saccharibacteria bacterium]|nr:Flp pilus assembly complex ATPase component TadA [Candidatus Saccharibacteria bacterium]
MASFDDGTAKRQAESEQRKQDSRRENEEAATARRASILGLPYVDTRAFEDESPLVENWDDMMTIPEMHKNFAVPFKRGGGEQPFRFFVTSATPRSVILNLSQKYKDLGEHVEFALISETAYRTWMLRYDPPEVVIYDDIKIANQGDSETLAKVSQTLNTVAVGQVFDFLIEQADLLGASDIHIENLRDAIRVRLRVDGMLHVIAELHRERYRILMGELGSRANLSLASSKPQSGHIHKDITRDGHTHTLNIRIETVPTLFGQDAVLRLFNFNESLLNLDLLGISKRERETLQEIISHPRGLALMVGPTGSGKSTTLYSILNALNTNDRKIITLEDPIEFSIAGISQVPIKTTEGAEFAGALRSVLRLDPDVVMVGEIRDKDTARTAIQASITGHLVLSSFHANSASAAFARMIDLIGQNPIFASSVRMVIAQRLVRKLTEGKQERDPTAAEKSYITKVLEGVAPEELTSRNINLAAFKLYDPVISEAAPFGYSGRFCLMEQLIVDEEIQKFLRGDVTDVNAEAIEKAARADGMLTLEQKGILAVLAGETTLSEIARVI